MEAIAYTVPQTEDGATVRHILRARLRFSARAVSRLKWRETGILVNGERAFTNRVLHAGDVLRAETGDQPSAPGDCVPGDWPLPVVWEDGHLLVVDKPAGMTAHASNFSPEDPTVAGALAWRRGTDFVFHPVNRLDRGTTGLMVVAKSGYIHDRLRRTLHTDAFRREYLAVCTGSPAPDSGTIDAPIARDERSLLARRVRPDGKSARTRYRVLASGLWTGDSPAAPDRNRTDTQDGNRTDAQDGNRTDAQDGNRTDTPDRNRTDAPDGKGTNSLDGNHTDGQTGNKEGNRLLSFVELRPETGRTHQIRVHMAHLGCPLAGDWLYGREDPDLIGRPALHSHRLELVHPVTGEVLRLTAPLPPDMARLVRGIGKRD